MPEPTTLSPATDLADGVYVGRVRACGCAVAAFADRGDPTMRRDIARDVGRWIRSGLVVQWVPAGAGVALDMQGCPHGRTRR